MTVTLQETVKRDVARRIDVTPPVHGLPWLDAGSRRRGRFLYQRFWVRDRRGGPWDAPPGTEQHPVQTPMGTLTALVLPGRHGAGSVVLAHPDRRYGGHWFVKEGWVDALHAEGRTVVWFDQPGYGQGKDGSPYLAENILNVSAHAARLDPGPVAVIGVSLGSFAAAIAAPHMPWVDRIVLESPYRTFASWYEGRDGGTDKLAMRLFGLFFRRHAEHLDTQHALATAPQQLLVALAEDDDVTPTHLSEKAVGDVSVQWHRSEGVGHLGLWAGDPTYRQAVLDFIR